jgi:hypothetical protein
MMQKVLEIKIIHKNIHEGENQDKEKLNITSVLCEVFCSEAEENLGVVKGCYE